LNIRTSGIEFGMLSYQGPPGRWFLKLRERCFVEPGEARPAVDFAQAGRGPGWQNPTMTEYGLVECLE
jgi:hypothetical protein